MEQLPHKEFETKNYSILSLYVHCSPVLQYSKADLFREFNTREAEMLARSIAYVAYTFRYLQERKFADEYTIKKFRDVFFSVAPTVSPIVKNLSL